MALAQDNAAGIVTPGVDKFQLDPSRDPARNPQRAGPEVDNSITRPLPITPPPANIVPTQPTQTQPSQTRPTATQAPTTQTPAASRPAQPSEQPARTQPRADTDAAPAPTPLPDASDTTQPVEPVAPIAAQNATETPAPVPDAPTTEPTDWTPWLIGAGVLLLATAFLFLRRRRAAPVEAAYQEEAVAEQPTPETDATIAPVPPLTPVPPARAPIRVEEDRPRLAIGFQAQSARVTLVGAAVGYRLTVHNEGTRAAEDVTLTGMMTNADAQQQAVLANFFTTAPGIAGQVIGRIEPGQTLDLDGEMRLAHDQIVPIEVQGRKLLIPVVVMHLAYQWTRDQRIDRGTGRNGAAFIVGQESDPPREKMAPLRLDQGPRQYRSVGVRSAQNSVSD